MLTQGGQTFEQDELCFDMKSRRGLSRQAVTVQGEAIFHAAVAKRQADERIHVANAKFTTCDAENPHFHFHLKRAVMIPGEKVVSGPFYLKFRKIPTPLALPFGWFPTPPENAVTALDARIWGRRESGFFPQRPGTTCRWGIRDTRLTADTRRRSCLRNSTNYKIRYRSSGNFNVSFQRQRIGFTGLPSLSTQTSFSFGGRTTKTAERAPTAASTPA